MVQSVEVSRGLSQQHSSPITGGGAAGVALALFPLKSDSIDSSSKPLERSGLCGLFAKKFRGLLELIHSLFQRLLGKTPKAAPKNNDQKSDLSTAKPDNPPDQTQQVNPPQDDEEWKEVEEEEEELPKDPTKDHSGGVPAPEVPAQDQAALNDELELNELEISQEVNQDKRIDLNLPQMAQDAVIEPLRGDLQLPKAPEKPADMQAGAQVKEADVQAAVQNLPEALYNSFMLSFKQAPQAPQPAAAPELTVAPWISQIIQNWQAVSSQCQSVRDQLTDLEKNEASTKLELLLPIVPLFLDFSKGNGPQTWLIAGNRKTGNYKIILTPSGKILLVLLAKVAGGAFKKKRNIYWLNPPLSEGQAYGKAAQQQVLQDYAYLTAAASERMKPQMDLEMALCCFVGGLQDQTGLMPTLDARVEVRRSSTSSGSPVPLEKAVRMKLMQVNCGGTVGGEEWIKNIVPWLNRLSPQERAQVILSWMLELAKGLRTFHQKTGYINSDIKPANVLFYIDQQKIVHLLLTDYGLAQPRNQQFFFNGTPLFWPPSAMLVSPMGLNQLQMMGGDYNGTLNKLIEFQQRFKCSSYGNPDLIDMHGLGRIFYFLLVGKELPNYSSNTAAAMQTGRSVVSAVALICIPEFDAWHNQCKQHPHELVRLIAWMTSDNFRHQNNQEETKWTPPNDDVLVSYLENFLKRAQNGTLLLPDSNRVPA